MIGDSQRIAVLPIAQQELSLVIGAPQLVGMLAQRQGSSLSTTTQATAALDQTVPIKDRMDGALGRNLDARESPDQALADFPSAPAGVLPLHVQDEVLHLKRQLIGIAIGTTASVGQSFDPAILVAIKNLVAGLAGDSELPAKFGQWLPGQPGSHELHSLIHHRTLLPRHRSLPSTRRKCHLCVRYDVLPMSQAAHFCLARISGRRAFYMWDRHLRRLSNSSKQLF